MRGLCLDVYDGRLNRDVCDDIFVNVRNIDEPVECTNIERSEEKEVWLEAIDEERKDKLSVLYAVSEDADKDVAGAYDAVAYVNADVMVG